MKEYFSTDKTLEFEVTPPLYTPFYNEWGKNAYSTYSAFDRDAFSLRASSTSGSPVVICGEKFFGFMNTAGGKFRYNGRGRLEIFCPKGQVLWYNELCNPYEEWRKYNEEIIRGYDKYYPRPFHSRLEYCTWVDQKNVAAQAGSDDVFAPLCEKYVYEYMKRVEKLGLPKGKLTIDDGWYARNVAGKNTIGDWEIDRDKFPHMEKLVKDMENSGFIPGLWLAPFTFTPNCALGKEFPDLVGEPWSQKAELDSSQRLMFIKPSPVLEKYYTDVFSRYIDMGFKKFKLDMSYGPKNEMTELLKMIYGVIKKLAPETEVETHIPDIFASRYCDTVRINDVAFDPEDKWRAVTMEHYKVCRFSSHDRILNLDHIGTNTPVPEAEQYIEHARLLTGLSGGYPCASLLPDFFGGKIADEYVALLKEWAEEQRTEQQSQPQTK